MKGFTLIEVLIALAIVAVIAAVGVTSLSNFNAQEALSVETVKVISLLSKARSQTLSAKGGNAYGVHFEERKAVLFKGAVYSASDPNNQTQVLHTEVKISALSLLGGGSEVVFKKLTGGTAQSGTVTLSLARNPSVTKLITIAGTGIAYSN